VRVGLLNGFDIGVHEQDWDALALDAKIRLLKGRLDIAIDPGLQVFYGRDGLPIYFHAPVLFGINLSDRVSVVLSPGFVYTAATGGLSGSPEGGFDGEVVQPSITTGVEPATTVTGAMAQMGFGLDFRITHKLAIHPEVTFLKPFDTNLLVGIVGIGFNIGAQPDYSDLADAPQGPAAPVQTPPAAAPSALPSAPVQPAQRSCCSFSPGG
jgi:hypothetical protein